MFRVSTRASFGLRFGILALASSVLLLSLSATDADARSKRKNVKRSAPAATSYSPRYADIVVDANTGDLLHSTHPDAQRHPASLTKIMTLYLLFERLEAGTVKLDSQMEVSAHAARQAPTKLGLRPGQTLMVEDAIKALVTKSANDAAVVVAEYLAGSEDEFAKLMTRKARALRMTRTVYKNASGLPDDDQVTTARDQALLGLAIQDRFPRYYRYFSTQVFAYRGIRMSNHNRLLGRVEGVNGIKTGYTRASGFNLVTAVQRGDRRIVAVVLGGASAGARDAKMRSLIEQKVSLASVKRTAPKIVEIAEAPQAQEAPRAQPLPPARAERPQPARAEKPVRVASAAPDALPAKSTAQPEQPTPGSTEPIRPRLVKTLSVKAGNMKTAAAAPMSLLAPEPIATRSLAPAAQESAGNEPRSDTLPPPPPGARPGVLGVLSAKDVASRTITASAEPAPLPKAEKPAAAPAPKVAAVPAPAKPEAPAPVAESKPQSRSGWIIQVGAFEERSEATDKLAAAKTKALSLLKDAEPYTELYVKGDQRFYRARFAGLKENAAEQACRQLKKSQIACFAVRN